MYKAKVNYPNGSSSKQKKLPPKPKPEFSTDFIDREKYKLSEAQMVQKKASLQSRHRQEAIKNLQQRRRKLEQGIIDQDTRKVYQTALVSKNIDLNPPPRKNLSQMIQYEREKQQQRSGSRQRPRTTFSKQIEDGSQEESQNEEIEKQLKDTRDFIKKLQRVKKVDSIERAVDIIAQPAVKKRQLKKQRQKSQQRSQKKVPLNNQRILKDLKESKASEASSQEEALSSIEDTIRFMQERLFSAKRIEKIKQQEVTKIKESKSSNQILTINSPRVQTRENLQLSGLKMNESQSQDECLKTIRRMKEMMEGRACPMESSRLKQNRQGIFNRMASFQQFSTLQKPSAHQGQAQVDFSLTINQSQPQSHCQTKISHLEEQREYERLKKSLFQEVNRLQLQTPEISVVEASFNAKAAIPIDQSSITNLRSMPTPPQKMKKMNPELAKLRNQIQSVRDSVQSIKVQPLAITKSGEVMGIDFRGSINIKKHIVQQK